MPVAPLRLEPDEERRLAATIFNHVWALLGEPERSASQDSRGLRRPGSPTPRTGGSRTPIWPAC